MTIAKNATIYRVAGMTAELLEQICAGAQFKKCAPTAASSCGFVPVRKEAPDLMTHLVAGIGGFAFRTDTKLLPGSIINAVAAERAAEIEEQQGYKPGRAQMREIKEATTLALLQVAFVKTNITRGWYDAQGELFVIDSTSPSRCDDILGLVFRSEHGDGVKFKPLSADFSPSEHLCKWVASSEAPEGFTIDDKAAFVDAEGGKARVNHISVTSSEVISLSKNRICSELAMTHDDKISFVLTGGCLMKGLNLIGIDAIKDPDQPDLMEDDKEAAELTVTAGLVRGAANAICEAMGA